MKKQKTSKKRKVLVIGLGSIGQRHLGNLLSLKELLSLEAVHACDPDPRARKQAEREFDVVTADAPATALKTGSYDFAVIAAPTRFHIPYAVQMVKAGAHVMVEKPLSFDMKGIPNLLRLLKEKRKRMMVGCNLRFQPSILRIKDLLVRNQIGKVTAARVQSGHWLPDWRPRSDYRKSYSASPEEGGALLDCIQPLDCLQFFFGRAHQISAFMNHSGILSIGSEDTAQVQIRFRSGPVAQVHVDYVQRYQEKSIHIIGDRGTIIWEWTKKNVRCFQASSKKWKTYPEPAWFDFNQTYKDELIHFFNGKRDVVQTPQEGIELMKWVMAAKKSDRTLRTVTLS